MHGRKLYKSNALTEEYFTEGFEEIRTEVDGDNPEANLLSSECTGEWNTGMHMPTLDMDVPCTLIPSSTEGHFHLLIDVPMSWEQYTRLLDVMWEVGILQEGFVRLMTARGATFVRKPGVRKNDTRNY